MKPLDPRAWCVVCMKPLGSGKTRRFPDGCVAHAYCFMVADSASVRHHMNYQQAPTSTTQGDQHG